MNGFTKLFSTIVTSSIWDEDDKTRVVWITMLALADRDGNVSAAVTGLANAARVSIADCERALAKFLQPDKYSRTQEHEGRRIMVIQGGWHLLNHATYRAKMNADERRSYKAAKQAEYRAKTKKKRWCGPQSASLKLHSDSTTLADESAINSK